MLTNGLKMANKIKQLQAFIRFARTHKRAKLHINMKIWENQNFYKNQTRKFRRQDEGASLFMFQR